MVPLTMDTLLVTIHVGPTSLFFLSGEVRPLCFLKDTCVCEVGVGGGGYDVEIVP